MIGLFAGGALGILAAILIAALISAEPGFWLVVLGLACGFLGVALGLKIQEWLQRD